jgi:O-antigen ligase
VGTCLLPAIAIWSRISEDLVRRTYYAALAVGAVAIVANLIYIATNFSSLSLQAFFVTRLESSTLNAITLAHLGVSVFILSGWGLVRSEIRGRLRTSVLLVAGLVGLVAAVMAASRAPLLILVIIVPLLLYQGFRSDRRAAAMLGLLVLLPSIAVMWLLNNVESVAAIYRLQNFASDDARRELWSGAWQLFIANPILGAGTEPLGYYPHNTILESLLLYGVFSGVLYVTLLGVSIIAALRLLSAKTESGWVALLYFQTTLGQMVSGALYGPPSQWVLMVAVIALWQAHPARDNATARLPGAWAPAGAG